MHYPPPPSASPKHIILYRLQLIWAALLRFCKTPGTLRNLLAVVLMLQPLLGFLAWRVHLDFWNYVILNLVFIGFWRLSIHVYKKSFPVDPEQ